MDDIKDLELKGLKLELIDLVETRAISIKYPMSLIWAHKEAIEPLLQELVGKDKAEQRKGLEVITDKLYREVNNDG